MIRLVSGLALALAALAAILFLPTPLLVLLVAAIAWLTAREYGTIAAAIVGASNRLMPWVAALVCVIATAPGYRAEGVVAVFVLIAVGTFVLRGATLPESAAHAFALVYVSMPLAMLVRVRQLGGTEAVVLLIATVAISDSAQYYTGRMFGRHALAPRISPKKTIEGAVGGVIFGAIVLVVGGRRALPFVNMAALAVMGVLIVLLGISGDLFESRLKRTAGMKDSSALIPGHGGVLDRIDALLFVTPAFYLFLHEVM
jgi:phosphatidate cytidylyltransferase